MTKEEELKKEQMEKIYGEAPKLDLSKIKNTEALKGREEAKVIIEKSEAKTRKEKKSKFCFSEDVEVNIPSRGYLYQDLDDEDAKNGIIRLKPMSLADEEIISNQSYIKNGSVFRHLLNSCMVNNFDAKELIPYDVYYLIYQLRQITYGKNYEFEVECPECSKKFKYELDMSNVEFAELEDKVEKFKTIKLPRSKFTVTIRCSLLGDEEELAKFNRDDDSGESAKALAIRTLEILDDENEPVNPRDFTEFYEAMPAMDRVEIVNAFKEIEDMEIPTVNCTCPKCGAIREMTIPFNKQFFRY